MLWLAVLAIAVHLATAGRYGIFRDELYYVACARHLAWGYVDHPPLIALITWLVAHSLGTSLLALRLLPALAAGCLVLLTAAIARELGGQHVAQFFAALAIVPVPIYLILDHWLTMNAFEPLLWSGFFWCSARMIRRGDPRYWLGMGVIAGVGLENKYSILFCIAGLLCGLILASNLRLLRTPWFLAGCACALLLFLPNLLWLIHHGFPFLEFERNSRASGSRILRGPLAFLGDQVLIMNPVLAPLWLGGLGWLFAGSGQRYRALGWACITILFSLLMLKAKNYYLTPIYPLLFAAGAVALERATSLNRNLLTVYVTLIFASGLFFAPLVMPILSPEAFVRLHTMLHGFTPVRFEDQNSGPMPQYFSDEFGWEAMARQTAKVFATIPQPQRARTAIFANDYGEAAAIDFFGPRHGLPAAISKNESYWLWGPRDYTGESVIVLGSDGAGDREHFKTVQEVGVVSTPYSRADEHFTLFLCHDLYASFPVVWPKLKAW